MGTRDKRIDAYIRNAAPFAQPILASLREQVHAACPEAEETLKWGHPSFMYHGILCGMAAFKAHATFGFWKVGNAIVAGADEVEATAMGNFGRLTDLKQLPSKRVMAGYIRKAMVLNATKESAPKPKTPRQVKPPAEVPDDLTKALSRNKAARAAFENFSNSHRREYIEWITEAKRSETREKRVAQTVEWLAEGKSRNWKYLDC